MLNKIEKGSYLREIILTIIIAVIIVFTLQSGLKYGLRTKDPIVVVVSGSMEPTFERGDVLILKNGSDINTGEVVTYDDSNGDIPIVHRVEEIINNNGETYYVTWGDNNPAPDTYRDSKGNELPGVPESAIENEVVLVIPEIGHLSLWIRGR